MIFEKVFQRVGCSLPKRSFSLQTSQASNELKFTQKELAKMNEFGRKQLRAKFIAEKINSSPLTLVARTHDLKREDDMAFRAMLKEHGFECHNVKNTTFHAATKFYTQDTTLDHIDNAKRFFKGKNMLLVFTGEKSEESNLSFADLFLPKALVKTNMANLRKNIAFQSEEEEKVPVALEILPWKDLRVVGGFLKEQHKINRNIWLEIEELNALIKVLEKSGEQSVSDPDRQVHDLFHSQTVSVLTQQMNQLVQPLQTPANELTSKLSGSFQQIFMALEGAKLELKQ
eukprot:snap_masked-scaffold_6-processed-gene-18.26-mRNA-1 protein AED:1.00 eAED:1.00 QI:0/-1/0/0/-1/1/1/0/285